jgi:hypothetical protein
MNIHGLKEAVGAHSFTITVSHTERASSSYEAKIRDAYLVPYKQNTHLSLLVLKLENSTGAEFLLAYSQKEGRWLYVQYDLDGVLCEMTRAPSIASIKRFEIDNFAWR